MNFERAMAHTQRQSRRTLAMTIELQTRGPARSWRPESGEGIELHEARMKHIKRTLAEIDEKLRRLKNLL